MIEKIELLNGPGDGKMLEVCANVMSGPDTYCLPVQKVFDLPMSLENQEGFPGNAYEKHYYGRTNRKIEGRTVFIWEYKE